MPPQLLTHIHKSHDPWTCVQTRKKNVIISQNTKLRNIEGNFTYNKLAFFPHSYISKRFLYLTNVRFYEEIFEDHQKLEFRIQGTLRYCGEISVILRMILLQELVKVKGLLSDFLSSKLHPLEWATLGWGQVFSTAPRHCCPAWTGCPKHSKTLINSQRSFNVCEVLKLYVRWLLIAFVFLVSNLMRNCFDIRVHTKTTGKEEDRTTTSDISTGNILGIMDLKGVY